MKFEFWEDPSGKIPVKEELSTFDSDTISNVLKKLERFENYDFQQLLRAQVIKKIPDSNVSKLYELRFAVKDRTCRIFFVFQQNQAFLLHLFMKKTAKTPLHNLKVASDRAKTCIQHL